MAKLTLKFLLQLSFLLTSPCLAFSSPATSNHSSVSNPNNLFALIYSIDLLKSALDKPESELKEALEEVPIFDRNWEAFSKAKNGNALKDRFILARDLMEAGQFDQARDHLESIDQSLEDDLKEVKRAKISQQASVSIPKSPAGYNDFETNPYFSQLFDFPWGGSMRDNMRPMLVPQDHPVKPLLDGIFLGARVTADPESILAAGFYTNKQQWHSATVVTSHPALPGYLFKFFYDREGKKDKRKKVPWRWLYRRVLGARKIQQIIREKGITRFTVPNKWFYPLPINPSPPNSPLYKRKDLIVVEDAFTLATEQASKQAWMKEITPEHLLELYWIVSGSMHGDTRFHNIPRLTDGRFAFIDMEHSYATRPDFKHIQDSLSRKSRGIWRNIISHGGKYW